MAILLNPARVAIITCVDYDDYLAVTLPYNIHHFDKVLVVTSTTDVATHAVCQRFGAQIVCTDEFTANNAVFNKGKGINVALRLIMHPSWICLLDADTVLPPHIPVLWNQPTNQLFWADRRLIYDSSSLSQIVWDSDMWNNERRVNSDCLACGYFQLFHTSSIHVPEVIMLSEKYATAEGVDMEFRNMWPTSQWVKLPMICAHLGDTCVNWLGRVSPRLENNQSFRFTREIMDDIPLV